MKKNIFYFFILLAFFSLFACSKKDTTIEQPDLKPAPNPAYELFGISKNINIIKGGKYRINGKNLVAYLGEDASKSNNAWAGYYDSETKDKFIEFTDNEKWPQEAKDGLMGLSPIFYNKEGCVLYLTGSNFDINYNSSHNEFPIGYGRFYFVKNNKVVNKIEGDSQNNGNPTTIINFRNYLDGFILAKKDNKNNLSYDYFDHTLTYKFNSNILAINPASFEEEIIFDNKSFTAKKINLITNKILFEKKIEVDALVFGSDENTVKELNGNEWIITNKWKESIKNGGTTIEIYYMNKYTINILNGEVKVLIKRQKL